MANSPSILDAIQISARIPSAEVKHLKEAAKPLGGNLALIIRQLIEDSHTFYGLPDAIREELEADAKRSGKDQRRYVIDLLTRRYAEIIRDGAASSNAPGRSRR